MARRKRNTVSSANKVGGCLWRVGSQEAEHHVIAEDDRAAVEVFLAIPSVMAQAKKDPDSARVIEVKRIDTCVFALPVAFDADDDRSQG